MSLDEAIAAAVERQLAPLVERLERALGEGHVSDGLVSIPKAAAAVDLDADTIRRRYLPKLKKYGTGKRLRVSVADLRRVMAEEREDGVDVDALAESITKRGSR